MKVFLISNNAGFIVNMLKRTILMKDEQMVTRRSVFDNFEIN
jgi:hypothetical protein